MSNRNSQGISAGAAAILSLLLPGVGQACQGSLFKGLVWFTVVVLGYFCFVVPGFVLHVLCVVNAAQR